jgi:aspartate kinase
VIDEISPRSQDSIIGAGEKLACKIVAASLRDRGVDSEFVNLDTIVDEMLNEPSLENVLISSGDQGAAQLGQDFYDRLAQVLGERIRECGTRVPVITGMFSCFEGKEVG